MLQLDTVTVVPVSLKTENRNIFSIWFSAKRFVGRSSDRRPPPLEGHDGHDGDRNTTLCFATLLFLPPLYFCCSVSKVRPTGWRELLFAFIVHYDVRRSGRFGLYEWLCSGSFSRRILAHCRSVFSLQYDRPTDERKRRRSDEQHRCRISTVKTIGTQCSEMNSNALLGRR